MDPRKPTHSSAGPKETSPALGTASADIPPRPPVALPSDLATSLRYLEGSELQRLQAAVEAEIARRKQSTSTGRSNEASAPGASRPFLFAGLTSIQADDLDEANSRAKPVGFIPEF